MANSVPPRKNPGDPWRAEGAPSSPPARRRRRMGGWGGMILAAVAVFLITDLVLSLVSGSRPTTISYSEFGRQLAANNISKIYSKGDAIEGQLRKASPAPKSSGDKTYTQFKTQRPVFAKDDLWGTLTKNEVTVTAEPVVQQRGILYNIALSLAPVLLLVLLWLFVARRMSRLTGGGGLGGLGGFGRKTPVPIRPEEGRRTTFEDVAGIDEVEAELNEVVDFLKRPDAYRALGARMPRGVLLAGPPGTGKTLLARAVAGEADVPFFSASASEFIEMIVGVGAGRVRELFAEARKVAPAIIFIDEIDTIGRARGAAGGLGGHDEREQTLNQILTEMDGFSGSEGVVVIAATNRPDVLDPALTRPGRFDRTVHVSPPDRTGREAILRIHLRDVPLQDDIDLMRIARATPGMTGAELANLANEAALLAVKRGKKAVGQSELSDALEKVQLGAARPLVLSPEERRRTAYHESGHALLGMLQPGADPVRKITIVPRGRALGVTLSTPDSDRYAYSEEYLRGRIIGALGGMAAEHVVFGVITTGAENDLEQVTNLVRGMVGRWGMSDRVGPLSAIPADAQQPYGLSAAPATLDVVDAEMRRIVDECYGTACSLLDQHREQLDSLAERLLESETLEEGEAYAAAGIPRLEKPSGNLA